MILRKRKEKKKITNIKICKKISYLFFSQRKKIRKIIKN